MENRFRDVSLVLMIVDTLVTSLGSLFQVYAAETGNTRSHRRCRLLSYRPLKIRTDGGHAWVRELGSIDIFSFLL